MADQWGVECLLWSPRSFFLVWAPQGRVGEGASVGWWPWPTKGDPISVCGQRGK